MIALPECKDVYHMGTRCPWRSEEHVRSPATGVAGGFKPQECDPAIHLCLRLAMKPAWPQPCHLLPWLSGHWYYRFVLGLCVPRKCFLYNFTGHSGVETTNLEHPSFAR